MRTLTSWFILILIGTPVDAYSQEIASLREAQALFKEKSPDTVIATLQKGEAVELVRKTGNWYKLRTASGKEGWVPLLSVRLDANRPLSRFIATTIEPATDKDESAGEGNETGNASNMVRGLNRDNIGATDLDRDAVKALDKYALKKSVVESFASDLGLRSSKLEYLISQKNKMPETSNIDEDSE